VPEAVHAPECSVVWGEEVGSVSKYGEEQPIGDAMAQEGSEASSGGGEAFDEGEDGLGQQEPVSVVLGSVEGRGEPVS